LINKVGRVEKGWGYEQIHFSNQHYCLKELVFTKQGNYFSMHFHAQKHESWLVLRGSFKVECINPDSGKTYPFPLLLGGKLVIEPLCPHRLTAMEADSVIMEVSTADHAEDNYRVAPGMSQR
jgi:mannose-6-phosphate isomerase-like protein (cupin superfamily)